MKRWFQKPRYPVRHYPEDFLTLAQLGCQFPSYRATFVMDTLYINDQHRFYSSCSTEGDLIQIGIKGFLRQADALKLYELAYHVSENILEMGSAWGLSTSLLCQAIADAKRQSKVTSLEIDTAFHQETCRQINQLGLQSYFEPVKCDAIEYGQILINNQQQFELVFIDHCHSYGATCIACQQLRNLIIPGGFVLFHDFNDERNRVDFPSFGVYQGVLENLSSDDFIFSGVFGCSALYQKIRK